MGAGRSAVACAGRQVHVVLGILLCPGQGQAHDGPTATYLELEATDAGLTGTLHAPNHHLAYVLARNVPGAAAEPDWFARRPELLRPFLSHVLRIQADGEPLVVEQISAQGRRIKDNDSETILQLRLPWASRPTAIEVSCMLIPAELGGRTLLALRDAATGRTHSATLSQLSRTSRWMLPAAPEETGAAAPSRSASPRRSFPRQPSSDHARAADGCAGGLLVVVSLAVVVSMAAVVLLRSVARRGERRRSASVGRAVDRG